MLVPVSKLPFVPSSWRMRRHCVDTVGFFDETLRFVEDLDLWLRLATRYRALQVCSPCWCYSTSTVSRPEVRGIVSPTGATNRDPRRTGASHRKIPRYRRSDGASSTKKARTAALIPGPAYQCHRPTCN